MGRRWVWWLTGVALIAAACGGGEDSSADDVSASSESDTIASNARHPSVKRASELAVMLVDHLGDDDSAVGAVLLAGDAGHSIKQIEAAVVSTTLAADGSVDGVQPTREATSLITALSTEEPNGVRIVLKVNTAAQESDGLLPIEQLRREAAEQAGAEDYWPTGAEATALILSWQLQGYSQEQIVNMLILGVEVLDGDYDGQIADGEEECGGYVVGGEHEIPQFCDPDTGELYPDEAATTDGEPTEVGESTPSDVCQGNFAPPYSLTINGSGIMLETQVLGPLETPYYYSEVSGSLDIDADGTFKLTAHTVRYADIVIRDEPDNQIYIRDFEMTGFFDLTTGDGEITGTVEGTDQLWSGDSKNPVSKMEVAGLVAIVCDDAQDSFEIFGVTTSGAALEFHAVP